MTDKPLGRRNYEQFAERYAQYTPNKPHNGHYERPAMLGLLPELDGCRVLDAGCGPGHYAVELLDRGAELVAVDVTPAMVTLTRELVGDRATVLEANLEDPLSFARDGEFDGVIAPLVLDYIEDWGPLFREFARVLKPGGFFLFSSAHPMSEFHLCRDRLGLDSHYFEVETFDLSWGGFGDPVPVVTSFRRPLQAMLVPLIEAGLELDRFVEPKPTEECRRVDPVEYEKLMQYPNFLCIRARRRA